jgi:hypothetical protein
MNTPATTTFPADEWQMGGSKEPGLEAYGITEAEIAMCAVDAIHYAMDKAGGNLQRFAYELSGEFTVALSERLGVDLDD